MNKNGVVLVTFWMQEKYDFLMQFMEHLKTDWGEGFGDLDSWDDELKRYLAYFFNKKFGSDISSEAIYNRFRKYLSQKNGENRRQAFRVGKNGRVHSRGNSDFKLRDI